MKKRLLSLTLIAALCLSLFPTGAAPALAAAPDNQVIYVGGVEISSTGYWTTDSAGNVTAYSGTDTPSDNYIHYDAQDNILTLHNATIKKSLQYSTEHPAASYIPGSAIGVFNQNGNAELTIQLEGDNTIAEVGKGIYVLARLTGGATLTITGDGSLDASASQTGIWVQSNSGNASLSIKDADVEATGTGAAGYGVNVQSCNSSTASLSVDGGSLTASGSPGILYDSISSSTVPNTTALTISNSAIVDARGGGIGAGLPQDLQPVPPSGDGIVFDKGIGTVYGSVTLQKDLTIGEGESLKLDDGASLNANGHNVIVDGGTLDERLAESLGGSVIYKVTSVSLNKNNLTLDVGKSDTLTATITPSNATNQNVAWSSDNETVATVSNGLVTAIAPGTATITVTTEDGSKTATCTVIVHTATTITTQPQSVSVTEGQSATFSVTATGDNLRYQWQINSSNGWSAITGATDASYTIDRTTTAMSGNQYRCIVTGNGGETTSSAATLTVRPYDPPYTGKYSYEIVSDVGENGTIDVDRYATEGDQVTITVSPDEAYLLDDLTVTSGGKDVALTDNGDGTYTFTMPSGDVAITATFAEDPNWEDPEAPSTDVSEIFTDVPANHWAQAAIQYVYDNGLMTGVSDTAFAPEATTTRAMIVSMLARMENVTSAADAGFADVAAGDWYATAVNWAAANGIVSGISNDTFAPNDPITREQLAAMLMNYAQWKGQDTSARADLSHYSDAENISSWANDVLSWAVAEGLLTGVTDDTIAPQVHATRAQVAAILQRFLSE